MYDYMPHTIFMAYDQLCHDIINMGDYHFVRDYTNPMLIRNEEGHLCISNQHEINFWYYNLAFVNF